MRHFSLVGAVACLLLISWAFVLSSGVETVVQAAQPTSTPTPETRTGYTNYSGYYRMRCWPACHTKDIPESVRMRVERVTSTPTPERERTYTNYSGYYRIRCWPACHTKDIPESIRKAR
jgi:hypothetical protein